MVKEHDGIRGGEGPKKTYSFRVDGVHGKQQRRHQAGRPVQEGATHAQEQHTHDGVQHHVEQVVGGRAQLTEQVVQPKGEHRQRPVGFMAPLLR